MLDADPAKRTKCGTVTIDGEWIREYGFEAEGASCRDVTALAMVWAIGRLQQDEPSNSWGSVQIRGGSISRLAGSVRLFLIRAAFSAQRLYTEFVF